ncbi:MAG: tetratricopeptide repeat protein [bacterium]
MPLQKDFAVMVAIGWMAGVAWCQQSATNVPALDPALDRFYSANALYNKKLYVLAVPEYEAFLKQHAAHPKADQARFGLALSYFGAAKYAEAEPILADLGRTGKAGDAGQIGLLRSQCLLRLSRIPEAEKVLSEVASSDAPKHLPAAFSALTEVSFLQGKWPETVQWADKLLAQKIDDAASCRAAYQAAYAAQQLRQQEAAIQRLTVLQPRLQNDPVLNSQAAFLLGECYRETGRHAPAIAAYVVALSNAQDTVAVEIQFRIGVSQLELGQPASAIAAFKRVLGMKPAADLGARAALYLGRALVESGDLNSARTTLQPLTQLSPRSAISAEASLWLARALVRQNQIQQAVELLGQAIPSHAGQPLQADLFFEAGNLHLDARRYVEASSCFAALMQQFPAWPQTNDLWRLQSVCLHHQKQYEASLKLCDDYLKRFPADPRTEEVAFVKAENLFLLSRPDRAMPAYQMIAGAYPDHPHADIARFRVTLLHYKTNAWEQAVVSGEALLRRQPKGDLFAPLPFLTGDAAFRLGQWDKAVTNLASFVRQSTKGKEENLDTALAELGVAHLKQGRTNEAMEQFAAVTTRFPQSRHTPLALGETGRLRYERDEPGPARQALEALLAGFREAPQRAAAEYYLGWIARAEKKPEEAARRFEAVTTAYPNDPLAPDAAMQRGLLYLALEKYPEAQAAFEQLLQRFPGHARADLALFSQGIALARSKLWQKAATILQQYRDKYPRAENDDRVLYELAWCEKGLNHPGEAAKCYQALITAHPQSDLAVKSRTELAEISFDAKDFDKTIAELTRTLEGMKDTKLREEVMYRLGSAHFNKGDWRAAATVFEQFLAEYTNSTLQASSSFQAGEARLRLNEASAARTLFAAAVAASQGGATAPKAADPKVHESALLRLGEAHGLLAEWDAAVRAGALFQQQYPKSPYARLVAFNQGWALENLKRYEDAIQQFRTVVDAKERDVLSARCQFHIGECLYGLRRYDLALVELVRVQANYGHEEWTVKSLLEMGRVLEAKGDLTKAQEQFKEVIRKYPKNDAARIAKERLDGIRMSL